MAELCRCLRVRNGFAIRSAVNNKSIDGRRMYGCAEETPALTLCVGAPSGLVHLILSVTHTFIQITFPSTVFNGTALYFSTLLCTTLPFFLCHFLTYLFVLKLLYIPEANVISYSGDPPLLSPPPPPPSPLIRLLSPLMPTATPPLSVSSPRCVTL